jgi:hypothetical protein
MNKEFEYEYNPIKEQVNGKAADKVIWSTAVINKALEGIQSGQPLKASPFLNKNTKLLKPELVRKYTQEEIEDYKRCALDPLYFAEKCFLMTPKGLQACKLRDYQKEYIKHLQNNRFSILLSCRQSGKSTTTAIYCLWVILFNADKTGLILSKSGPAGVDLIKKIKDMYLYLPYHLKIGTMKWNQTEISFDNNSSISTESFSPTAGLGKTINFLILDEFAWCPPNDVELFYNNIIPTVTTISDANVCIMSTQNGFNLFYKLWKGAIEKTNIYAPFKVDWNQVPQYNNETGLWEKRTVEWKEKMIGVLGSVEAFYYQYGTQFSASDKCLVSRERIATLRDDAILYEERDYELTEIYGLGLQYPQSLKWDPTFDLNDIMTSFFLILIDLAEGYGGDYTVFNIFKIVGKDQFQHVGYWRSNEVDLEHAALEFWLLAGQLFNGENCIWSLEWNTYGALFYRLLMDYNEDDYEVETKWRFTVVNDGIELSNFVQYKKSAMDEQIIGRTGSSSRFIPGIKFTSGNKGTACSLLKTLFEKGQVNTRDVVTLGELENFEDKNGNGTYKASYGHDDLIMTFVQIPMVMQTGKYTSLLEDIEEARISGIINNKWNTNQTQVIDDSPLGLFTQLNDELNQYSNLMQ